MSSERKQVLDMLAEGKINAEEASRLLEKLEPAHPGQQESDLPGGENPGATASSSAESQADDQLHPVTGKKKALKFLRVLVDSEDGDVVNIQVPLALIRTGIKMQAMLPPDTNDKLAEKGVDLSYLSNLAGDDLIEALRDLNINVDSASGDKVHIFCE